LTVVVWLVVQDNVAAAAQRGVAADLVAQGATSACAVAVAERVAVAVARTGSTAPDSLSRNAMRVANRSR
jgi:hypothetical protein